MSLRIIKANELEYYLLKQNIFLVDIRGKQEYEMGHIQGAFHVPLEQLDRFFEKRDKNQMVILYCERGITSVKAANRFSKMGYRVGTLAGGFSSYNKSR